MKAHRYPFPLIDVEEASNHYLGPWTGDYDMAGKVRRKPTLYERIYEWFTGSWPNEGNDV